MLGMTEAQVLIAIFIGIIIFALFIGILPYFKTCTCCECRRRRSFLEEEEHLLDREYTEI